MANHLPRLDYFGYIGAGSSSLHSADKELQWNQLNVEYDFPKTFRLNFVAGRDFQSDNINDSNALILNEAAIRPYTTPD